MSLLDDYRREFPNCQCGDDFCHLDGNDIHEIAGGTQFRQKARKSRACILHLSRPCHQRIQGEPYAKGLARKLLADWEGFSLESFVEIIGRAPGAITMDEVLSYLVMV